MDIRWEDTQYTMAIGSLPIILFKYIVSKRSCDLMIRPENDLVAAEKHPLKICAPKALFLY